MMFLRPEWLCLIPFTLGLTIWLRRQQNLQTGWSKLLPPEFHAALTGGKQQSPARQKKTLLGYLLPLLLPLAIAGPSFESEEIPVQTKEDALVILLDLSLSMLATDESPSRLIRARQKILDLLDSRVDGTTALIVFAGSAHVVTPLTEDNATIRAMLPALDPMVMPDFGSRLPEALRLADELLSRNGSPGGRILLIGDGLDPADSTRLHTQRQNSPYPLSILAVGTTEGGPVPIPDRGFLRSNGEIVIVRTDAEPLQQLLASDMDRFARLSLDGSDLRHLLPESRQNYRSTDSAGSLSQPRDIGYWLLIPVLLLLLWSFRRQGVLLLYVFLVIPPDTATAADWENIWKSQDRLAYEKFTQGSYEDAADSFTDPLWQAASAYKAERYDEATRILEAIDSAPAHYNRGNAFAMQGKYEEAVSAYDQALQQNTELKVAEENRQKILDLMQQQQQQQQQQAGDSAQTGQGESSAADQQSSAGNPQPDPSADAGDSKSGDNENQPSQHAEGARSKKEPGSETEGSKQEGQAASGEPDESAASEVDPSTQSQDSLATTENPMNLKDQQTEQWLRRIPDDPGGLLRRKFLQQYQEQGIQQDQNEGRLLW